VNIAVEKGKVNEISTEALLLTVFQDEKFHSRAFVWADQMSGRLISEAIKNGDFEGKPAEVFLLYAPGSLPSKRILLVGLGKREDINLEKIRQAFSRSMQHLRSAKVTEAAAMADINFRGAGKKAIAQAMAEGALLGLYQFTAYKTVGREEIKEMDKLTIFADNDDYLQIQDGINDAKIIVDAVYFVRDMVSAPSNEMTPSVLAKKAMEIARRNKVSCTIMGREQMRRMQMNALLGVAAGSNQEPKFIILEYRGGKKNEPPIVLAGKGLTFDSGGICLKPAEKMDEMKSDMSGGAAVMGALMAAADLHLPINIVSLIPATENMPGGSAFKPGDILKSYSGKTIEVINTDAEGRLILADALAFASKYKPAAIIDVATLTGACVVALGEDVIGMMGNNAKLKKEIVRASKATGELVWELPLWECYSDLIKSDIADYKNSGGRPAGAITAAAFLSKFVGDFPWVHLDIAGPAWRSKERAYMPKGASGIAVRLLVEYLRKCK